MLGAGSSQREGSGVPGWGGDEQFADLVQERRGELVRVAVLVTGNLAEAEDAVQDAIVSVAAAWSRVTKAAGYGYLRTAVVRKALDGQRRPTFGGVPDTPVEDLGFLRLEEDRLFVQLLQRLPQQQRAVVVLRHYSGLDIKTIAEILQIGRPAVRSNLARGLAALRATAVTTGALR